MASTDPPEAPSPPKGKASLLDRALRIVGDVQAGEGARAAVLGATLFLLLFSYYLLKVARETLVLSHYDAEVKVYVAAGQAVLLVPAVWAFGWLSGRVGRFRLVVVVTIFFAVNLGLFALAYSAGLGIALPFYVWVGVFNVFVIAQLWAFANDVYTESEGRRLFAVIGLGSSLGAIAGAYAAEPIGDAVGTGGIFVSALVILLSTLIGARWVHRHSHTHHEDDDTPPPSKGGKNAFALLISDRYFLLIAALLVLLNCENTLGEYLLDRVLLEDIETTLGASPDTDAVQEQVRAFKSLYYGAFNTAGFLIQLFLTGRVMKKGGAGAAILVLPVIALLGQAAVLISGVALMVLAVAKVSENSLDYSLNSTARNALFLVVPREAKYPVKVLLDSVVVRMGDVIAGGIVLGGSAMGLDSLSFVAVSAAISSIWLAVAFFLRREHNRRAEALPEAKTAA
jgi:AAA family ATP:ADP antiporter